MKTKSNIQIFIAASLLLFSGALSSAPTGASSQATKVAVVDHKLITRDSMAAKGLRNLIEKRYQRYQAEIKDAQNALEKASDELKLQSTTLDAEQLKKRRAEIRQQATELSRILQSRKSELDQIFNRGMAQIDDVLNKILKKMAQERGINMFINATKSRRIVLFIDTNLVLTNEALERLDKMLPKVELVVSPPPSKRQ